MNIYLDKDFYAKPDTELLGYVGELNTRIVDITGLNVINADSYYFIIEYDDEVKIEIPIINSYFTVTSAMLRAAGKVNCQIVAKSYYSGSEECRLVMKSNIFTLVIKPSISGNIQPLPDNESLLGGIRQAVDGVDIPSPKASRIITDVIADALEKDIAAT
ncbi:MAG: hypothetical protein K6F91_00895 [Ruminococcus sp.]|nr:hypothetical protein [Ruminococcus sp.]